MPELPEVETVMRALTPLVLGRRITQVTLRAKGLRTPFPKGMAANLTGLTITHLSRRAKYILLHLPKNQTWLVHLGMTGTFITRGTRDPLDKHDHVVIDFDDGSRLCFNDPRRFGQMDMAHHTDLKPLAALGPEPLEATFTPFVLAQNLVNKKTTIKAALLDQQIVSGLGNIYVSEALFYARIHPQRRAGSLKQNEIKRLCATIKEVLTASIKAGGSTLKDYRHPDGNLGFFQNQFAVYGHAGQACPGCNCKLAKTGGIKRIVQSGRSSFFCATKQK